MKMCDRCRVPGCLLNYNGKACKKARQELCPDVVFAKADRIREMTDKELADFLCEWAITPKAWQTDCGEVLNFLQEEDSHED